MIVGGSDPKAEGKVDTGIPVASGAASAQVAPVIDTPPVEKVKPVANEYDALLDAAPSNEYDAIIENGLGDQGAALKTAMKTAQDTVPDQYKKAKDLSERTGIPVDSVERNLQAVEKQAPWLSNEYDDLLKDSPTTAAFLAEKDHAKLAKDDIKPLSVLEQIARMEEDDRWLPSNMGKIFMGGLANTNRSIAQAPAAAFSAITLPGNLLAKATGTGQVEVPDWLLNNPVAEYYRRAAEYYSVEETQGNAWEDLKTGDIKKASRVLAAQIISNAPSQFVAVGSAAMGLPTAGLTFMGATSGASQLSKNADAAKAQEYDKDPAQTAMDMLMNGGIEVLGERYGTFGIFKVIEKSVAKQFGKATAKTLVAEVGKNIALAFGGEGLEEFSTQLGQDLSDYATGNPRALDGTFSRAANAFLVGAGSGLSITSPTAIYSGLVKSHHLNMDQKFWDNFTGTIADKVNGSKLRERDPGAFEIHVGKVLEDSGKPTKLYVSPEAVRQFFQVDGRVDEAAYNSFIDEMQIRDQLQEAAAAGKDFEISAAKFATKYAGSDLSTALKPDIRFSPDGMTLRESEAQRELLARNVEEMRAEYATMVEENRLPAQAAAIREKLILPKKDGGFGLKAEDADANMLVFMAGAKALSKHSGETTDEWFARVNPVLNVGGQYIPGSLTQRDYYAELPSKGKDVVGRPIPIWDNVPVYHSTSKKGLQSIKKEGFRVDLGSEQGGYYGTAVSFTPDANYSKQFGEVLTLNRVLPGAKILNLNDPADWETYIGIVGSHPDMSQMHKQILDAGYDGVYDAGAGDLFIYNPAVVSHMGVVDKKTLLQADNQEAAIEKARTDAAIAAHARYGSKSKTLPLFQDFMRGRVAASALTKDDNVVRELMAARDAADRVVTGLQKRQGELFQKVAVDKDLVAMHNLSAENLAHADKMGGLAVPSLSIGKDKHPLSGFGEISLVGSKELIDPRASAGNAVFNADVYSPRYPNVEYDFPRERVATATPEIKAAGAALGTSLGREMDAASVEYRGFREFSEMTILKLAYLNSIGVEYKVPLKKANTPTLNLDPELKKIYKSNSIYFAEEAKGIPGFLEAYERARLKERENFIKKDMKNNGATQAEAEATYEDLFKGVWYDEEGNPTQNVVRHMANEAETLREKGKPDYYEARNRLSEIIRKGHEEGYQAYARKIFDSLQPEESIIHGQTRSGDNRYLPHNLENVVRVMKSKLQDGEGFNYGVGSIRATVAKQFRSVTEMQQHRDQIIPKEQMDALKEEVNQELFDLMDKFKPYSNGALNGFGGADNFSEHLKEMTTRGVAAVVKDYYGGYVPEDTLQAANDFLNKLRNMPTEYFEAKLRRAVGLNEFAAALVPDNVSQETLDILKKNGIETVVKYDRNKGNTDERAAALKELRKTRPELFFQDTGAVRGSVQFTPAGTVINLFNSANMSTFLHEMGHVFVNDMGKLVASGRADAQLVADYETMKAYAGDINTVEGQEKLARAFEAYLRDGKAPSLKLVQAFRRFKQWLTAIYRAVAGLNVEVTPEVKQVFDRLLASETEIQEAERFYGMKRSLVDLIPTDPARKTAVKQLQFNAEQTALERQAKTLLRAYLEATGGRAAIRAQAEKEIDAMPVYKALKMALERGGIDPEALIASHGKDAVEALKRKFPGVFKRVSVSKGRTFDQEVRSRGGIDPKTMGEYEIQTFNEQKGSKGILRKGGGAWDDMAASLQEEGLLQVPDNRNASDYLRELVEQKKEIPGQKEVDPQERTTIHELAVELDYASPEALVYDLTISPRRSEAVSTRAREIMQQKEQEILSDIQKQELLPGEEAVHSDATITYLIAEMEVLGEKIDRKRAGRPAVVEQKAYRAAAAEVIGRKKVSLAGRYDLYASAEQRYARQALEATEKGDFETAFEAKRKQILNHMMVQEAIKARDQKLDIEKSFRPKKFKARLNNVENAFADTAIDLASAYGLSDMEAKTQNPLDGIADADDTLDSMIPAWIRAKANAGDYRNLTMNELRELDGAIDAVLSFGSDVMKSIEAGEMKTLQEWVDASVAEMFKLKDRTDSGLQKYRDESSKWSKFFHTVDAFVSSTTLTQMLTDWMDNFSFLKTKNAGPFKRLYNKVLNAEVEFNAMKTEVMQATKKAWSVLGSAAERIHKQHGTKIVIPGVEMSEDMKRTDRAFWSVNRMIALLLNTGNAGNLEVTKRGLGFTDAQIQKVAAMFTAEELQAIQEIWDATDILFPKLDATHFAIYNRNVAKVEAAPVRFTSLDGQVVELKGGYYPLVFDHQLSDRAAALQEDDMMKNQTAAVIRSVKPSDGMTKGRVEGHSLPPMLDTAVWFTHIDRTARYISHARILRDLNRFTRNKDWSREFKKKAGDAHYKTLRSWLQHNANPGRKLMNGPLDRAASYLKSTATAAVLGFKVAVGLKQRVALINTAQALGRGDMRAGWSWILKAYKEVDYRTSVAGVSNGATWEAILKKSSYLKTRDGNIDREISDLRRGIDPFAKKIVIKGREFTAKDVQDFAFEWIKMNDRSVVAITWTAAVNQYMQEKADGLSPEEAEKAAIAYADGIVQDTQASSLTPELSEMQRQEGWLRLFTSFMTSAINYGNRVVQNHRAWTSGAITNKEYMNHVMHEVIAFPWVTLLISEAFRGKLPEWWDFLLAPFEAFTSFMPVIRDVFAYKYGKGVGDSPIFELPRRTVRAVADIPKLVTGDKDFLAFLWDVGRAAEAYFKVPALNFVKDVKTVFDNIAKG